MWEIVNFGLELYAEECARELPGELSSQTFVRSRQFVEEALLEAETLLQDSGTEYRAFLEEVQKAAKSALYKGYRAIGSWSG